jgi:hypothetical protein
VRLALRRAAATGLLLTAALQSPVRATEEVPFITTPDNVTLAMLELAAVRASDHVIDLGSGDGRIVILAAKRFGASGLGVEIVPDLVQRSREHARAAGVETRARFLEQDLFKTDLSAATVVTMYLLPEVNLQLRPALLALAPGTRIVSHDWDMGDWAPDRSITVAAPDKTIGREKSSRLHLWHVPARVQGLWCGTGAVAGTPLRLTQTHQMVAGDAAGAARLAGRLEGSALRLASGEAGEVAAAVGAEGLRITRGVGAYARWQGMLFTRAAGETCR